MPNGDDDLSGFNPSWMEDGIGIGQPEYYTDDDDTPWNTLAWSEDNLGPPDEAPAPGACNPGAPPTTGTFVMGVVDGTCQWIDTTQCPPP
jgi:hypothetical protein